MEMKNGLLTITSIENDHGPSMQKHHKRLQRLIVTKRRLSCSFGGIAALKEPNDSFAYPLSTELVNREGVKFLACIFGHSPNTDRVWLGTLDASTI